MSDTITETPTSRRGAPAAPRPRRRGPLARRRLRRARPLLRHQPAGLPDRVRRARPRRRHRPAALSSPRASSFRASGAEESIAVEALRRHRDRPWLLLGVGLLSFGALLALSEARFWPSTGNLWLAATLGGRRDRLVARLESRPGSTRQRRTTVEAAPTVEAATGETVPGAPPVQGRHRRRALPLTPKPPARPSLFAPVLGALLAAAGLFGLLAVLDVYDVDLAVALAAGVAIVGVAIAVGAMTQRRVGGLVFLGLILLAAFGVAAATPVSVSSGVGEKTEQPESVCRAPVELRARHGRARPRSQRRHAADRHHLRRRQRRHRKPRDHRAAERRARDRRPGRSRRGQRAGRARRRRRRAQDRSALPGRRRMPPCSNVEADVGIGNIEVRRG